MWQHLLALPLVAKVIGFVVLIGMALWGSLKHKAVAKISSAATNAVESKFWGWAAKKLSTAAPSPAAPTANPHNEKTYRGSFVVYAKVSNYPGSYIFTIEHDGVTSTVPVISTPLLLNVHQGDFVEIDTQAGTYIGEEVVLRVRTVKEKPNRSDTEPPPHVGIWS